MLCLWVGLRCLAGVQLRDSWFLLGDSVRCPCPVPQALLCAVRVELLEQWVAREGRKEMQRAKPCSLKTGRQSHSPVAEVQPPREARSAAS